MNINIKNITAASFKKYGYVIAYDSRKSENFQIVLKESDAVGWRIAVSKIENKRIYKVARHPNSMESFEPMEGTALICVAPAESPKDFEIFLLDKPVCLFRNIWHATLTLSEHSLIKICENANVDSEEYHFENAIEISG
ncbi:MAG: hypothetical protein PWP27_852 [Clostridiales bacterium]|jgi:ureidoglycolate hydrolase|nr:hypothetical protein [Clostridiales bacterium]MDK2933042.1 hypothetical protein [Clostridiales bacterium]